MASPTEMDQDVFEITDFTTASDWERFVSNLEEVFHEWKLPNMNRDGATVSAKAESSFSNVKWRVMRQEVSFADFLFVVERHWMQTQVISNDTTTPEALDVPDALTDIMMTSQFDTDFVDGTVHELYRWYGLRDFLVVSPALGGEAIANESRAKLLLSSVCLALNNTGCHIPVFVRLLRKEDHFYVGICEGKAVRTNFQMVHLGRVEPRWTRLAGLLDIFKSKIGCALNLVSPIAVSVCFTYLLKDWDHVASWPQAPPDVDALLSSVGASELGKLPFGAYQDPIREIVVCSLWQQLTEDVAVDNTFHSDLDPIHAPCWRVAYDVRSEPNCLLGEYLFDFIRLGRCRDSIGQILGVSSYETNADDNSNIAHALDRLSGPMSHVPSVTRRLRKASVLAGVIPESKLKEILFFLFPDALGNYESTNKSGALDEGDDTWGSEGSGYEHLEEIVSNFKSSPRNSILYLLATCLCHISRVFGRSSAVAHLWHEIVLELRYRWENSLLIPRLELGTPNLSTCLLHQKFQMLNYCIGRKRHREESEVQKMKRKNSESGANKTAAENSGGSSDDDDFYDCNERDAGEGGSEKREPVSECQEFFVDSVAHFPEGRLRRCNDLLLVDSDVPLYIPITQDPSPMTEDQLEEHAEVLVQLGTDEEGVQLRARMQSACLLSDMQAFKAANPGCLLEDFVRWYSPRDWVEADEMVDGNGKSPNRGSLSSRMLIPGNVWQEVWNSAKPIPVRRQKRLFDDTKEGEKVLHYLASLKPADVVLGLMPTLLHAAIITVVHNDDPLVPFVRPALESIANQVHHLSKTATPTVEQYEDVIGMLSSIEATLSQAKALNDMFVHATSLVGVNSDDVGAFVEQLLKSKRSVDLPGGSRTPVGKALLALFRQSRKMELNMSGSDSQSEETADIPPSLEFPSPDRREYVLRCLVHRPAPYSAPTPQFMYCRTASSGDFRLAGAFSQDTTFQ